MRDSSGNEPSPRSRSAPKCHTTIRLQIVLLACLLAAGHATLGTSPYYVTVPSLLCWPHLVWSKVACRVGWSALATRLTMPLTVGGKFIISEINCTINHGAGCTAVCVRVCVLWPRVFPPSVSRSCVWSQNSHHLSSSFRNLEHRSVATSKRHPIVFGEEIKAGGSPF